MFYSASKNGFYSSEIHGSNIPQDSVEISQEDHLGLLQAQACGKQIIADSNGYPVAVDRESLMTIEEIKVARINLIEEAYSAAIQEPVSYLGTTFQADEYSQSTLAKALSAGSVPDGFFWLDANNNRVTMNYSQLQGLAGVMLAQGQSAFEKKVSLKDKIAALKNPTEEDINSIIWE